MTREEAVKIINCYDMGFFDLNGEKISADKLADAFDMAIEALQERPTGKWIMHMDDLFSEESTMECNQCHEHQPLTIDDNYCPNCGAKMQGEE